MFNDISNPLTTLAFAYSTIAKPVYYETIRLGNPYRMQLKVDGVRINWW